MKPILFIIALLIPFSISAQPRNNVVIKGNVQNLTENFWELSVTGYYIYVPPIPVNIDNKGSFIKTVYFDGDIQYLYLYIGDNTTQVRVQPNDTITINWDNKRSKQSLTIVNSNPQHQVQQQVLWELSHSHEEAYRQLESTLYRLKISDSAKFAKINDLYNQELADLLSRKLPTGNNEFATNIYFKYILLAESNYLLNGRNLTLNDTTYKRELRVHSIPYYYTVESEDAFRVSPDYRTFLFNYLRSPFHKMISRKLLIDQSKRNEKAIQPSHPWADYYSGMANLSVYEIRDWYLTNTVMYAYQNFDFSETDAVYKEAIEKIKMPLLRDSLQSFRNNFRRLKPGNVAPAFTLKNEKGQSVSLKDFAGKVVYIDFWGVYCGPCLQDIKDYAPALHSKYKDKNIVFINICVDTDEKTWKAKLSNLKLTGINLLAEGWTNNLVCKAYAINAIPHYIIVDSEGKISDNNSPRPSDLFELHGKLDKLLSTQQPK